MKTRVRHQDRENRFVRTLGREPGKKELVKVEMFDNFFIENEEIPESITKQTPKRVIIEGLGEIGGQADLFNFSKNYDDFMFKFSFGTQNLFNKTIRANDYEYLYSRTTTQTPLTTTTTTTTTVTTTTATEEDVITTTISVETTTSSTQPEIKEAIVPDLLPTVPETLEDLMIENENVKSDDQAIIPEAEDENDPIQSDPSKSNNPSSLAQQLEDYLLVLPLKFRFLRKDSPLLQN